MAEPIRRYRKKPVVIEALRYVPENAELFAEWMGYQPVFVGDALSIDTLEGCMVANVGDWIIRGVKGEFYPCKPDIFEATYEPAEEASPLKIHLHNTSQIVEVNGVPARVWEGETEAGIPLTALITRIAVDRSEDAADFQRDLAETAVPAALADAWPDRMLAPMPPSTVPRLPDIGDDQAQAAIAALVAAQQAGQSVDVHLGPYWVWLAMSVLQLTATHPDLSESMREDTTRLGRHLQALFAHDPVLYELAERGWERDQDVSREAGQPTVAP